MSIRNTYEPHSQPQEPHAPPQEPMVSGDEEGSGVEPDAAADDDGHGPATGAEAAVADAGCGTCDTV